MKPVYFKEHNCVIAKNQPEYRLLPAFVSGGNEGLVVSCWKLSFWEKIKFLFTGRLWLAQMTFGHNLQPQQPSVHKKEFLSITKL